MLDVHTHTVASGHAFSSLQEMVRTAADLGLEYLGITEHGPNIPGTCKPIYFRNLHVVPREIYGVKLLLGAELNILDTKGTLDLDPNYYKHMDLRIAGIHSQCYEHGTRDKNTAGMIAAIRNPWVQMISHPTDGTADMLMAPIVHAAKEAGTILEINNSSLKPIRHKENARNNTLEILRLAMQLDMPVILSSDAHISFSIADYGNLWPLLAETNFPDRLILNYSPQTFLKALKLNPVGQ